MRFTISREPPIPVAFDRVLVEELGETAVDVLQGQIAHLPDQTAHPTDQHVDQMPREKRVALEQSLDVSQGNHETTARLEGHDRRGARAPVENQLAEVVALADRA